MFGKLEETQYIMYDVPLNNEIEKRYKSMDWNERQFMKLYMDLHDIKSISELKELLRRYGKVSKIIYRFRKNQVLSIFRYIDEYGICGATEWCDDYNDDFNEFIDTAIKAYFKVLNDGEDDTFLSTLKYKVKLYKC